MTRYLSSALGAAQPLFGQSIAALEQASGAPAADLHLSSELSQQVRRKVMELGLDPNDTTGPELYAALQGKIHGDEQTVRTALSLNADSAPLAVLSAIQKYMTKRERTMCFALKQITAKRLLKQKPPKVAMKRLGYRSLDSMLRHEPVAMLYTAALMFESPAWHKGFTEQYAKLQPSDFEQRPVAVTHPTSAKWQAIAEEYVTQSRHNILSFKDLGTIVLLPLSHAIDGLAITTFLLTSYYMNDIHAYSAFAKLQQVKPNFGAIIRKSLHSEQILSAQLAGQPVSWKVIQRYYGRLKAEFAPTIFEPHVQAEDLAWRDAEAALMALDPSLSFWRDTQYICMLYEDEPVSLNIIDVALVYCNHLHFADRIVHFVREHLWSELMSRYLNQGNLESAVQQQLAYDLVPEETMA